MPAPDAQTRFSNRVADYIRYRPGYPAAVVDCLRSEYGLHAGQAVADIGSGTGISSRMLLEAGQMVYAVEPNPDMRAAAEEWLAGHPNFHSVNAAAEATGLPSQSVSWVFAAQAFHWFDVPACRVEFQRILRPGGRIALLWNDWQRESPLIQDYEALVHEYARDYAAVNHNQAQTDGRIEQLFEPVKPSLHTFAHHQSLDYAGLQGRLLSSSYMPSANDPRAADMLRDLQAIFTKHAVQDRVRFDYVTLLYVGAPSAS